MRTLTFLFFFLTGTFAFSQGFRIASGGIISWNFNASDTTYSATVNFLTDLTGNSYTPIGITTSNPRMEVFSQNGKKYFIQSASNTLTSSTLRIKQVYGTAGAPLGQIIVYDPTPMFDGQVPSISVSSSGLTNALLASIVSYNATIGSNSSGSGTSTKQIYTTKANANATLDFSALTYSSNITVLGVYVYGLQLDETEWVQTGTTPVIVFQDLGNGVPPEGASVSIVYVEN